LVACVLQFRLTFVRKTDHFLPSPSNGLYLAK
jgi:hypothetical protein